MTDFTHSLIGRVANLELNESFQNTPNVQSSVNDANFLRSSLSSSDDSLSSSQLLLIPPPPPPYSSDTALNSSGSSPRSLDSITDSDEMVDEIIEIEINEDADCPSDETHEEIVIEASTSSDFNEIQVPIQCPPLPSQNEFIVSAPQQLLTQAPVQLSEPIAIQRIPIVRELIVSLDRTRMGFASLTDFTPPRRCGFYSCLTGLNGERLYREDRTSLRYLFLQNTKQSGCNLTDGYSPQLNLNYQTQDSLFILRYIKNNFYDLKQELRALEHSNSDDDDKPIADFICSSDILVRIMITQYNDKQSWTLVGVKVHGAIILVEKEIPLPSHRKLYEDRKFLEHVTRRHDKSKTNPEGKQESFYVISRAIVKKNRLLYTYPVHGAIMQNQGTAINEMLFIQTQLRPAGWDSNANQRKIYWKTFGLNIWCNCLFGKVKKLIFGDKEPGGWVKNIDPTFEPNDIPKPSHNWSPKVCGDFLDEALEFILNQIKLEKVPYKISYNFNSKNVSCERINEPAEKYIPSWYLQSDLSS